MVNLAEFQKRLQQYCRSVEYKQQHLARDIGLSPTAFSNKLNGTRGAPLSRQEIKNILKKLVQAQAITTRQEVLELLNLMNLKESAFSPEEWQGTPLDALEHSELPEALTIPAPNRSYFGAHTTAKSARLVTFLFTDIEGSTRLWQSHANLMPQVLARHNKLLWRAIEGQGGQIFKNTGDGICAVFNTPRAATVAAITAQRLLLAEIWPPEIGPLKVRMALHTGVPEVEEEGDFFGQPLNRTARLLQTGHGGQILLSGVVAELLRDQLPSAVQLRELGEHHLKDLERPEQIFQLLVSDLPADFPALHTLENWPGNLPAQLTSFIGREQDKAEIGRLLAANRLLTLVGTGGVGKTRLSLELAAALRPQFKEGVWLVELAALTDPALVPSALAQVWGVQEETQQPLLETLSGYLKSKQLLLVLDNCEHLIEECARLSHQLLRTCPRLTILATSREALGITGEIVWRLASLPVPSKTSARAGYSLEELTNFAGVKLFIERARAALPEFQLSEDRAQAVATICNRLDGIPLALELAAARIGALPVEQLAARLDQRFQILDGVDNRTALPRHQTLRALVDWSFDLLSAEEQALLGQLSVFVGSWSLSAVAAICYENAVNEDAVLDLHLQLVNKSLIVVEAQAKEEPRYRMLETIRQYSQEKLNESGVAEECKRRYVTYYLTLVQELEPDLHGPQQNAWFSRLEEEYDNLRAALGLALSWAEVKQDAEALSTMLRLGGALAPFWIKRGYWSEGKRWLETALDLASALKLIWRDRAKALLGLGELEWMQGDYKQAASHLQESLELFEEHSNKPGMSAALLTLGKVASAQGAYQEATKRFEESLALKEALGELEGMAEALKQLGLAAFILFDYGPAQTYYRQSLEYFRQLQNSEGIASLLHNLGNVAIMLHDYTTAQAFGQESLTLYRQLQNKPGLIAVLNSQAIVAFRQKNYAEARLLHLECLGLRRELGDKPGMAGSFQNLGNVAYAEKKYEEARGFFLEALVLYREIGGKNILPRVLNNLGNIAILEQAYEEAQGYYQESLAIAQAIGDKTNSAIILGNLGLVAYQSGNYPKAWRDYRASLALTLEIGKKADISYALTGLAGVCLKFAEGIEGQVEPLLAGQYQSYLQQAARFLGAVTILLSSSGEELGYLEQAIYNDTYRVVKSRLGEQAFATLFSEGEREAQSSVRIESFLGITV